MQHGAAALEYLEQHSVDIVVTDVLMPELDGFMLCRELRRRQHLARVPLVFYSATYTAPKDQELGLALGASRYLIKPLEPAELLRVLREVLREGARAPSRADEEGTQAGAQLEAYNRRLVHKLDDKWPSSRRSPRS